MNRFKGFKFNNNNNNFIINQIIKSKNQKFEKKL